MRYPLPLLRQHCEPRSPSAQVRALRPSRHRREPPDIAPPRSAGGEVDRLASAAVAAGDGLQACAPLVWLVPREIRAIVALAPLDLGGVLAVMPVEGTQPLEHGQGAEDLARGCPVEVFEAHAINKAEGVGTLQCKSMAQFFAGRAIGLLDGDVDRLC